MLPSRWLALLPPAGAGHGGDPLVQVAPALQVLLDGGAAVPRVDFHRVATSPNVILVCVVVACRNKLGALLSDSVHTLKRDPIILPTNLQPALTRTDSASFFLGPEIAQPSSE